MKRSLHSDLHAALGMLARFDQKKLALTLGFFFFCYATLSALFVSGQ
jgi:hypothetical protein